MKNLEYTPLLDIYGAALTQRQRDILEMYYYSDLSLGEISAETGITRQGVMSCLHKGEKNLLELEEKLGIKRRADKQEMELNKLEKLISAVSDQKASKEMLQCIKNIKDTV